MDIGRLNMITIVLHIIILLAFPLLFTGIINRVKSVWAGRKGPSLWQPYYDAFRLLKKGQVISRDTSFIFTIAPTISLAAILTAGLVIPLIQRTSLIAFFTGFDGDFILFAYLLAMGKFFSIIAAMDTGSSFEGMGAAREATFSVFVEPAFFLLIAALCFTSGFTGFTAIFTLVPEKAGIAPLVKALGSFIVFMMVLVEGCRVPVDDPNTHLELTMIHEVMILDNSGPDLAFLQYTAAAKMMIIASLVPNLLFPAHMALLPWIALYLLSLVVLAVAVGLIESLIARLRLVHVPQFIFLMSAIALVVLSAVIVFYYGGHP